MTSTNWELVCDCFEKASTLESPELEVYLDTLPPDIRKQVITLRSHDINDRFLDSAVGDLSRFNADTAHSRIGLCVGAFTIVRELNRGGTSIVYEATQNEPARSVALKVLRATFADSYAKRRFLEEAATLAKLRHPGIAQVYEAGHAVVGDEDVIYLAVEFVPEALDIVTYAQRRRLSLRDRIRIFSLVCDAVSHGHLKGFIHRDIKPANLLVDVDGAVKVIDFGIARSAEMDRGVTLPGDFLGTPQFMSPEQAAGDPSAVDARTDVYALGVVLYQLLTGKLPYIVDPSRAFDTGRIIAEAKIQLPSLINREISRDLESVALKAIAYHAGDRYDSVVALKADVDRVITARPVLARRASWNHRARLAARRNPIAAALGAVLIIALIASSIGAMYAVRNITRQRDAASETAQVLSDILSSPRVAQDGLNARVVDALDDAVVRIDALRADPAVRISLLETVAKSFEAAGDFRRTLDIRRRLLTELQNLHGADHPECILMRVLIAESLYDSGEIELARPEFEKLLQILQNDSGDELAIARVHNNLGLVMLDLLEHAKAEEYFHQVFEARARLLEPDHPDVAATLFNIGICRYRRADIDGAIETFSSHLAIIERTLGADHREAAAPRRMLSQCHLAAGRLDAAREQASRALEIAKSKLGPDHPETGTMAVSLARVQRASGDAVGALALFDQALGAYRSSLGEEHPWFQSVSSERAKLIESASAPK